MNLHEIQQQFTRHVLARDSSESLCEKIRANGIAGSQRLQIYRNNVDTTLSEVLGLTYPKVKKLVGENFFSYLARKYADSHPPVSGDVAEYGDRLPQFLSNMDELDSHKYLSDIAALEWCCHLAYNAADADPISIDSLAAIPESDYGDLVFTLHPSVYLVSSKFAIFAIWDYVVSHSDDPNPPRIDAEAQSVLIRRAGDDVSVRLLKHKEFAFLEAVQQGNRLEDIVTSMLVRWADFNLQDILQKVFALDTITNATTTKP